jgi:tRNA threonylcarbamoyl adenosine modification protein YeaZ
MRILAIEFSSAQRSVAVVDARPAAQGPFDCWEIVETGGQGTQALALIQEALRGAGLNREQIECIVVGLGPGSYTGIRAAIALAQGWQLGRGVKLLGISSADCVAAQARSEGATGRVAVVIDAQRGEFYLGCYELDQVEIRELRPLKLATLSEVNAAQSAGHRLVGHGVVKAFPTAQVVFPRAARLGTLAAGRTDFVEGDKLEPIYLRQTAFVKAPPPRVVPL